MQPALSMHCSVRALTLHSRNLAALALLATSSVAAGQRIALPAGDEGRPAAPHRSTAENPASFRESVLWNTGVHDGVARIDAREERSSPEEERFRVVSQTFFERPGAPWLRLHFGRHQLGVASFVRIHSLPDGSVQDLDAWAMGNWYDYSAFLQGEALFVELFVAPEDEGVFVEVDALLVGNPWYDASDLDLPSGQDTLCGADNRVASTEPRVGRCRRTDGTVFCSPYLASNGAVVMAGHCFDGDNNGTNERVTAGTVVEFDPPASSGSGAPNPSTPANQYPVDMTTLDWAPSPYTLGSDWGVLGLNPNTTNDDRAHLTRGFYRMTRETPTAGATIRITSLGEDSTPPGTTGFRNAQNRTEQTDAGPYGTESSSGALWWHSYAVDTTNGSSGAPIVWTAHDISVGVHTNAGCTSTGGANNGISFEHTALETALRNFVATNAIFVDAGMPSLGPAENGTVFRPYDTLQEGVTTVASGGVLSIVEGSYSPASGGTYTLSKPMTLVAPVGTVSISD